MRDDHDNGATIASGIGALCVILYITVGQKIKFAKVFAAIGDGLLWLFKMILWIGGIGVAVFLLVLIIQGIWDFYTSYKELQSKQTSQEGEIKRLDEEIEEVRNQKATQDEEIEKLRNEIKKLKLHTGLEAQEATEKVAMQFIRGA